MFRVYVSAKQFLRGEKLTMRCVDDKLDLGQVKGFSGLSWVQIFLVGFGCIL